MKNIKFDVDALAEVYDLLLLLPQDEFNKIPKEIIDAIKINRNSEYETNIYNEDSLLPETQKILAALYVKYIANSEEKDIVEKIIQKNKQANLEFKTEDIFAKNKENLKNEIEQKDIINDYEDEKNQQLVEIKENIFSKIINFIKKVFK